MAAVISGQELRRPVAGHARWLRISHWFLAASVLTLAFSGFVILMAHPRLYWGPHPVVTAVRTYDILGRIGSLQNGWSWYVGI